MIFNRGAWGRKRKEGEREHKSRTSRPFDQTSMCPTNHLLKRRRKEEEAQEEEERKKRKKERKKKESE